MRKVSKFLLALAAVALIATAVMLQAPLNAQENGKAAPKNLKVLTPENLMDQMRTYAAALGVESKGGCNFCHEADRSIDTPEKIKAREAIELTVDINKKFGDGKIHVTCWTCHHGSLIPATARVN